MTSRIQLRSRRASLDVDAEHGGRISSLKIDGIEVIVQRSADKDGPILWGSYPMVPFAGRIDHGRFTFEGVDYELPINQPPHAMHGYGFLSRWETVDANTICTPVDEPWPFAGRVEQRFELDDHQLVITMSVNATDRQPMLLGWHPWWRRSTTAGIVELDFRPGAMYLRGADGLPDGTMVDPPEGPWDDCFTELAANPVLRWGNLEVTLSSTADHWVVFDEPEHALCVEPQTGPPNMINDTPLVIDAGDTISHTFTIAWHNQE